MKKDIIIYDNDNNKINCDVLIEFVYDSEKYIVYTDNTIDSDGFFNLFKAHIDSDNKISDPDDVDVDMIFDRLINDYKEKVISGEV